MNISSSNNNNNNNNNMKQQKECVGLLQNLKKRLDAFEFSVWMSCVMLLLAVVLAVLPGFVFLGYAQDFLLDTPTTHSFLIWTIYVVKAVVVCLFTVMAMMCYADMLFPAVMETFVLILNRTALPDSIYHQNHQTSDDTGGTDNVSLLSTQSSVITE